MCGIKASAEQKQKLEEMMLELFELCQEKELYYVHDSIEDLIGMTMNTMLISINLKSQRLDKEKQEVKNIVEQETNQPEYSLSMGDEHLSTISKTESDEVIKSSVENLVPIPSEFEVTSDNENTLIDSSPKLDYLLEEFSGELAHIDPIPPGIEEADFDIEEEIHFVENLFYDNSSPRLLKELNAEIANMILESLSLHLIPVEDSHMEEINLFLAMDDLMPPGIENNDYDSEGDIYFLEELLSNDPLPLPENKSSKIDHHDDPSFPRPPPKPPDVEVFFDFEIDTSILTTKVVKGIFEHYVLMPNSLPTLPTLDSDLDFTPSYDSLGSSNKIFDLGIFIEVQSERLLSQEEFSISFIRDPLYPVFDTLLPFSSKNKDKVFKHGILSYLLVSHQDKIISDFSENPMMMYGGDIPLLDVLYLYFYRP
nr:hypothetical protein [Tanacetum cinerariifolium]GEY18638.1 hypothetical protein [Tanacetum cinerariifolium]